MYLTPAQIKGRIKNCPAGRGRPGDILSAERSYPAGDLVSHKPL